MKNSYNVLNESNSAKVHSKSSEVRGCAAVNVLCENEKRLWLSEQGLPQELVFDLGHVASRPDNCCSFGWYCWHSYKSNPSLVELWASEDLSHWEKWGSFQGKPTNGENLFRISPLSKQYTYLKLIICDTFGSSNTYLNQVFLYEDLGESISKSIEDSQEEQEIEKEEEEESIQESPSKSFEDPKIFNSFNFNNPEQELRQNFSLNSTPTKPNTENLRFLYSEKPENSILRSPGFKLNLPRVDEVGNLRKEISSWSQDILSMQKALEMISEKVENINYTCSLGGSKHVAKEIREEVQKIFQSEPGTLRSGVDNGIEEVFYREVQLWENQVFKPDLKRIMDMCGGSVRSADEILKRIDERLMRKAFLIKKKEMIMKLAAYRPRR